MLALGDPLQKGVVLLAVQADKVPPQLSIHLSLALDDVLVPPLFLKPRANFGPSFAGGHHFQPVSGRAFPRLIAGKHLADLAGFQFIGNRYDLAVDLGAGHAVAYCRVDGVGKVDHRGAAGQSFNVPIGGKHKDLIRGQVALNVAHQILSVGGCLTGLQHFMDPLQPIVDGVLAAFAQLILPVGSDTVLCRAVHIPSANLNFKGNAAGAKHCGVQGLVHIGLGGRDIVLKPTGQGRKHIVHNTQGIVAVDHRVHDNAHGVNVKDLFKILALDIHLAEDSVDRLHPGGDLNILHDRL